jgi:hypothetical protein
MLTVRTNQKAPPKARTANPNPTSNAGWLSPWGKTITFRATAVMAVSSTNSI